MILTSSLYLHFPVCRHLCNYCDFFRVRANNRQEDINGFHSYLEKSVPNLNDLVEKNGIQVVPLETVYFGGGTPSLWGMEGAKFFPNLLKMLGYRLASHCEWTMELNPGSWDSVAVHEWIDLGVNRVSMGLQSTNEEWLKALDRIHSRDEAFQTLNFLKEKRINYSVDFMIGLPKLGSKARNIITELSEVLEYNPSHFSVYILTAKPGYKWEGFLPNDSEVSDEYLRVIEFLQTNGYHQYEVSNFSKKGKESVHNKRYWNHSNIIALGPSATGFFCLNKEKALRYKWDTNRPNFSQEILNKQELDLEGLFLGLRTIEGIKVDSYFPQSNQKNAAMKILSKWVAEKKGYFCGEHFILFPRGLLVMDSLVAQLASINP